jgi:hypothetical protein
LLGGWDWRRGKGCAHAALRLVAILALVGALLLLLLLELFLVLVVWWGGWQRVRRERHATGLPHRQ